MKVGVSVKHDNSFDIIRHIAAIMVIYSHHFALSGMKEPSFLGVGSFGSCAVLIFFSISGYLISQSYMRTKSNYGYAKKRFLRVYPGLAVCLIFTIYICGGFLGKDGFLSWVSSIEAIKTYLRVIFLTGVGVVGVQPEGMNYFTYDYILSNTMNGSVWTLFFEVFDYIAIAFALSLFKKHNTGVFLLLICSIILQIICIEYGITKLALRATSLFTIPFAFGALLFIYKEKWFYCNRVKFSMLIISMLVMFFSMGNEILSKTIYPMALCYVTLLVGLSFKDVMIKGRFDFSYGIYIYAFPIQQIIINETNIGFFPSMLLSLILTIIIASISWFFVEKPMLNKKNS
ncbi:acyltransferase [Brenneria goodwinii]|uniref:Acyltransferase n=1 Tax=Brenneria goodwinii TaxID=1109412 RepID=A0AAE8ERI6_9GAMM|nr:acyltransferase [Brenneria goodwinii]ATA24697.1 acyltransferase [Brenneria goodwinii]RLM27346.1 acyltransferase [Brenneria goodwinii]